jgi:hypothetical protein
VFFSSQFRWFFGQTFLDVLRDQHGGAFTSGSGSSAGYDGATLAKTGLCVVSINYRVGAFGFFAHPDMGTEDPSWPSYGGTYSGENLYTN